MQDVSGQTGGWAKVKPITTAQYPLPARRPPRPVMSMGKVERVYGIAMPQWETQLRFCIADIVASDSRAAVTPGKT